MASGEEAGGSGRQEAEKVVEVHAPARWSGVEPVALQLEGEDEAADEPESRPNPLATDRGRRVTPLDASASDGDDKPCPDQSTSKS